MTSHKPDSVTWLRAEVARAVAPLSADLTGVLRRLIGHDYPPAVAFVEFQVFPGPSEFTEMFPVRAFFLDEENTEHFEYVHGKATYPTCVDPGLLDIRGVVPRETWHAWESRDANIDSHTVAAEAVVPWFASCWKAAGGAGFPLPAFVCLHDDPWTFDLRASRWLDAVTGKPVSGDWPPRPV